MHASTSQPNLLVSLGREVERLDRESVTALGRDDALAHRLALLEGHNRWLHEQAQLSASIISQMRAQLERQGEIMTRLITLMTEAQERCTEMLAAQRQSAAPEPTVATAVPSSLRLVADLVDDSGSMMVRV